MYRIKCGEILGGNSNQVADACSANLMTSLFSSACNSNTGGDIYYVSVCDSDILTRIARLKTGRQNFPILITTIPSLCSVSTL